MDMKKVRVFKNLKRNLLSDQFISKLNQNEYFNLFFHYISFKKKDNKYICLEEKNEVCKKFIDLIKFDVKEFEDLRKYFFDFYFEPLKEKVQNDIINSLKLKAIFKEKENKKS